MLRAVDKVLLDEHVAAALVEINPPSAVFDAGNIMKRISADNRAIPSAQRVNSAHVAENRFGIAGLRDNVMNHILLDNIPAVEQRAVAPAPTERNVAVEEMADLIACDRVVE